MAIAIPRFTVDDLERFPEDGNRYELLDGMLIVPVSDTLRRRVPEVEQFVSIDLSEIFAGLL